MKSGSIRGESGRFSLTNGVFCDILIRICFEMNARARVEEVQKMSDETEMMREENPLGTRPLRGLLFSLAVPAMIANVVNSLYNIVDQIFIGQGVGKLGNAAKCHPDN